MELSALELCVDASVELTPEDWARASLLGRARVATNRNRSRSADRGPKKNEVADLLGSLAELVLLGITEELGDARAAKYMTRHMFNPRGGSAVPGPDLWVIAKDKSLHGVDAKTFDCAHYKKKFAINAEKHDDLRGRCDWYFTLLAPPYGRLAILGKLVPYESVERWECKALGDSPSRNFPLNDFVKQYVSKPPDFAQLRRNVYAKREVNALIKNAALRSDLSAQFPGVEKHF